MTDSERQQILKMVQDGKITAAEGLTLMQALEEHPAEAEPAALPEGEPVVEPAPGPTPIGESEAEKTQREAFFARKVNRFRRLWIIPLSFGVLLTVGAAYWMYSALEKAGMGFWFFCASLPLALGIVVTALAISSRESRWLYLNVKQKPGEKPGRIVISFPMNLVTWLFNVFGGAMPGREREKAGMVMDAFQQSISADEPILVEVDEADGEHVQVYIG